MVKCRIVQYQKTQQCNIKWQKVKIVEHNIVQHLHGATLGSAIVNSATSKSTT